MVALLVRLDGTGGIPFRDGPVRYSGQTRSWSRLVQLVPVIGPSRQVNAGGIRQTFFHDVQALTRYLYFDSWQALINFMFTRLELDTDSPSPPRQRAPRR